MITSRKVDAHHLESRLVALCVSSMGDEVAWSEEGKGLFLAKLENGSLNLMVNIPFEYQVNDLLLRGDSIYCVDEMEGLHCYSYSGDLQWQVSTGAGGRVVLAQDDHLVVLDTMGTVHFIDYSGSIEQVVDSKFTRNVKSMSSDGNRLLVASEEGAVHLIEGHNLQWSRPSRGDTGESITALGFLGQNIVVGREGYALVGGDEEAIEVEFWNNGVLTHRTDLRGRLTHVVSNDSLSVIACDDGAIYSVGQGFELSELMKLNWPPRTINVYADEIVIGSWFYVFGIKGETQWKAEHQGIVEYSCITKDGVLVFGGEDQNDWTNTEPLGICNLDSDLVEIDPSELTLWFEKDDTVVELTAEQLYGDSDDVANLLSADEREMMAGMVAANQVAFDSLMDAMGDVALDSPGPVAGDVDAEELISALDDAMETMALLDEDEVMSDLLDVVAEVIAPVADAGDDQRHQGDDTGTCIVMLDGSTSFDPQGRITRWSWIDEDGREISDSSRVKIKLAKGNYRFELRVEDKDGGLTTDSIRVRIE